MSKSEILAENYPEHEFLIADGFDDAILGVIFEPERVIYSSDKCIDILMSDGMNELEAIEFFEFNVLGAYVGEKTPIFIVDDF